MTYPPSSGAPDPYQPQQPYGQTPDPSTPYSQDPYPVPDSGPQAYVANPYAPSPYAPSPYGAPAYPPYGPQVRTNALAIASLACSLGGLLTCVSAPVGIVLGHVAKRQIRQTGEQGEGMATAGLWIGYILTAIGLLLLVGWVVLFVVLVNSSTTTTT